MGYIIIHKSCILHVIRHWLIIETLTVTDMILHFTVYLSQDEVWDCDKRHHLTQWDMKRLSFSWNHFQIHLHEKNCYIFIQNSLFQWSNFSFISICLGIGLVPNRSQAITSNNGDPGARLTKAYDVTIQRYRNLHAKIEDSKIHILRCMGSKFCVKFQRFPLKFHTKFWTHTTQNMHFTRC